MPYSLLVEQIVYTSFAQNEFKLVASTPLSAEIQQAFMEKIVQQHWNSLQPLKVGIQAVYLYQLTPEHTLFGWLYNVGQDIPYFICYYLAEPLLFYFQLEKIFACLHKGPVTLMEPEILNPNLESVVVKNIWDYESARPGLIIPILMRARSNIALKQGDLLNIFVPLEQQENTFNTNAQTYDQEIKNLEIYARQLIKALDNGIVSLNEEINAIKAKVSQPYREYKEKLKQYEQAFISTIPNQQASPEQSRTNLKNLQRVLQLRRDDIERIEAGSKNIHLPSSFNANIQTTYTYVYNKKSFLLTASMIAIFMILLGFFDEIAQKKYDLPQVKEFSPLKAVGRKE